MEQLPISVIIPAYNSQATIEPCLKTLLNQSLPATDIIVVDDGSSDKTAAIVKSFKGVKLLVQRHLGPAAARNYGARKAKGKIFVFVDADMEFARDFLLILTRPIRLHNAVGTWSGNEWVKNWDNVWARCWNYVHGRPKARMTGATGQKAVFRAVRAKEFNSIGGFDSIGYTDDWTLVGKLGVEPTPTTAKFWHYNPGSLAAAFRHAQWIGKRHYKYGRWGTFWAIVRANPIFSLLSGIFLAALTRTPAMIIFKFVYDWGTVTGALKSLKGERY
jgi:glycosyltransferase involved in cell wall biosynthesis